MNERASGRYVWYVVCILLVVYMVHHLDRMVITLLLEPIRREFNLSDSQLGLLAGIAYAVPFALAGIPLGMLIDRVRRVRLLALLLTIWSGLTALCALAGSFWALFFARIGVAAAESGGTPANVAIISDYVPPRRRATALGAYYMGAHLGTIVGFAVAGAVAATYGWRAAFMVVGVPGLLLAALVLKTVREPDRRSDKPATVLAASPVPPSFGETLRLLWQRGDALHLVVGGTIANTVAMGLATWLPALMIRMHGVDLQTVGMTIAFGIAPFSALASLLGGHAADRLGARSATGVPRFLAVAAAVTVPGAAYGILSPSLAGLVVAFAIQHVAHVLLVAPSYAAVLTRMPAETRGVTAALMQVASNVLGFGIGAQIVGIGSDLLHDTAGEQSLRYAMLGLCVVNVWAAAHFLRAAALLRDQPRSSPDEDRVAADY